MVGLEKKNFDTPDETRPFVDKGKAAIVNIGGGTVGCGTYEPGWRWSLHVKPIVGTESCQSHHVGYILKGRMKIVMNDGTSTELNPGDVFDIQPGHDAGVIGEEACTLLDFAGMTHYAKPALAAAASTAR